MARQTSLPSGSWLLAEELLESGSDDFLVELRKIHDCDRLGGFGASWYIDRRAASRKLLLKYLETPFNCYRHESLIKRLFKLGEAAGDEKVMARFLVGFDRSLRRSKRKRHRYDWNSRQSWTEEYLRVQSATAMPRDDKLVRFDPNDQTIVPLYRTKAAGRVMLFSTASRRYLRRRSWRFFRKLGKTDPVRYITAITSALSLYRDDDCRNGLEMIDNWGLVHILFHDSPVLKSNPHNWSLAEGQSLGDLKPAPAFVDAWKTSVTGLFGLVGNSQCRPIRQWAITMLRAHHHDTIASVALATIVEWLASDDDEVSLLAAELLEGSKDQNRLTTRDWLELTGKANVSVLDKVCALIRGRVSSREVALDEVVRLCCQRPVPVAQLGCSWLQEKSAMTVEDRRQLVRLTNAECESVRPELVKLAIEKIEGSGQASVDDWLEFLDARYADVRDAGWQWLTESQSARNNPELWQRLLESPYDDVRLKLVNVLEGYELATPLRERVDPARVRMLWATVLLNIHRGGKQKPGVVRSLVSMLETNPDALDELLPLLRLALRSVRIGEWRSALAGLVRLCETKPELTSKIELLMPELILR